MASIVFVTRLYGAAMAEQEMEELPDFDSIKLPETDLAEISTTSMAQNVAALRSIILRHEAALADEKLDLRRLIFITGEVMSAIEEVEKGFARERASGRPPSMPLLEFYQLRSFLGKVPRRAIHKIAKRFPYAVGPFVSDLRKWAESLPDSPERKLYLSASHKADGCYEQMLADIAGIGLLFPVFLGQAKIATESFESLLSASPSGPRPPGMPPAPPHPEGPGRSGDDIGRRVSSLESSVEVMGKDMHAIAIDMATLKESVKHLATKEDLAKIMATPAADHSQGVATKEDLTPIAADIAWIKERLKHVPTKFGLLMAVAVPVASGLWWIFQQIFASAVS